METYTGTVAAFETARRYRPRAGCLQDVAMVRVVDVRNEGGVVVVETHLIGICGRLRELEIEVGDTLEFTGTLVRGRNGWSGFHSFRKLPPREVG
jgi:hypothetical protein